MKTMKIDQPEEDDPGRRSRSEQPQEQALLDTQLRSQARANTQVAIRNVVPSAADVSQPATMLVLFFFLLSWFLEFNYNITNFIGSSSTPATRVRQAPKRKALMPADAETPEEKKKKQQPGENNSNERDNSEAGTNRESAQVINIKTEQPDDNDKTETKRENNSLVLLRWTGIPSIRDLTQAGPSRMSPRLVIHESEQSNDDSDLESSLMNRNPSSLDLNFLRSLTPREGLSEITTDMESAYNSPLNQGSYGINASCTSNSSLNQGGQRFLPTGQTHNCGDCRKKLICYMCGNIFGCKMELEEHLDKRNHRLYYCYGCGDRYHSRRELHDHIQTCIRCWNCGARFRWRDDLEYHRRFLCPDLYY